MIETAAIRADKFKCLTFVADWDAHICVYIYIYIHMQCLWRIDRPFVLSFNSVHSLQPVDNINNSHGRFDETNSNLEDGRFNFNHSDAHIGITDDDNSHR